MDAKSYLAMKERLESLQRDAGRAQGQLEQLGKQLKGEFGCGSVKEAEKLLAKMNRELTEAERDFDRQAKEFEEKYGALLGEEG